MRNWKHKIELGDLFSKFGDDDDYDSFKEAVLPRLKLEVERLNISADISPIGRMRLAEYVSEIEDTSDAEEFDSIWNDVYDWADEYDVWIDTF